MTSISWFDGPILAIETSCDETSAAIVEGRAVRANIVSSQAHLHEKWGGVVPEAAARAHVEAVIPVLQEALILSGVSLREVKAIAVTNRPGLVGALSVGVTAAKAISFSNSIPLIGIHHLEGHLLSPFANQSTPPLPHLALVVSGGHTELVLVQELCRYKIVGQTIDDAAGEAFDKTARLMGLGYPGGRAIQDAAASGDPRRYSLPKGLSGDTLNFSFSGLKTAVLRLIEKEGPRLSVLDAAASLQEAIISVLADRALAAAEAYAVEGLTLVGGVAANLALRARLERGSRQVGIPFFAPEMELCTDNAAMIGIAGSVRLARGERDGWDLETLPNAPLP